MLIGLGLLLLTLASCPAGTFTTARSGSPSPRRGITPSSAAAAQHPMSPASSPGAGDHGAVDPHATGPADPPSASARPDAALAGDGPPSDATLQAGLDASAATDVPPSTAAAAVAVARQVLVADITGVGRAAFPGYWPSGTFQPSYHAVRIQAATVSSATPSPQGGPHHLDVTLLWSGAQADGVLIDSRQATIRLRSAGGSWRPVHPWDS